MPNFVFYIHRVIHNFYIANQQERFLFVYRQVYVRSGGSSFSPKIASRHSKIQRGKSQRQETLPRNCEIPNLKSWIIKYLIIISYSYRFIQLWKSASSHQRRSSSNCSRSNTNPKLAAPPNRSTLKWAANFRASTSGTKIRTSLTGDWSSSPFSFGSICNWSFYML